MSINAPERRLQTRRQLLRVSGTALAGTFLAGCSGKRDDGKTTNTQTTAGKKNRSGRMVLQKVGQLQPSGNEAPSGGYSEVSVRADGKYAVVGSKWGLSGSYLIDLGDPANPKQVHYLDNPDDAPNLDVKFDSRDGLYYRAIERHHPGNFEIVDYGHENGSPANPTVVGTISEEKSHNVTPHPTEPVLYTVNYRLETNGFDVYGVNDPTNPNKLGEYGPQGQPTTLRLTRNGRCSVVSIRRGVHRNRHLRCERTMEAERNRPVRLSGTEIVQHGPSRGGGVRERTPRTFRPTARVAPRG
ncbi:hypothetical protein ACFFQF_01475 [Haladaptatus pallidirubidus]